MFSIALKNDQFKKAVLDVCFKKVNGEQEMLFNVFMNEPVATNLRGSASTIKGFLVSIDKSGKLSGIIDYLCKNDPTLTFLLHDPIGDRSVYRQKDIKVYINSEKDNIDYYLNGSLGTHNKSVEPQEYAFVVRSNEDFVDVSGMKRRDINAKVKSGDLREMTSVCGQTTYYTNYSFLLPCFSDVDGDCGGGGTTGSGGGGGSTNVNPPCDDVCERDCYSGKEYVTKILMNELHESWIQGRPDIFDAIGWGDNGFLSTGWKRFKYPRHKKGGWCDLKEEFDRYLEIITWDRQNDGIRMKHAFIEEDAGSLGKLKLDFSTSFFGLGSLIKSASWEHEIKNDHDQLGSSHVEYCDKNPRTDGYFPTTDFGFQTQKLDY